MQAPSRGDRAQRVPDLLQAARAEDVQPRLVDDEQRGQAAARERRDPLPRVGRQPHRQLVCERRGRATRRRPAAAALQRARERRRPGDLELDDGVRGRRGRKLVEQLVPRQRALAIAVGRPRAAARIAAEPLGDHVALIKPAPTLRA
jgi:hypothetical protein